MNRPLFALGSRKLCASFLLYRCLVTFCGDIHFCFIEERYKKNVYAAHFGIIINGFLLVFMYAPYKSNNPRSLMMRGLGYIVVCLE